MKYKEIIKLLHSDKKLDFRTLRNILFTCFQPEKQIRHLMNLEIYFSKLEENEIIDFVEFLKENKEIKNCLDGLDLPIKFINFKKFNSLTYSCYIRNGAEYTRQIVEWLLKNSSISEVISTYDFFVELN